LQIAHLDAKQMGVIIDPARFAFTGIKVESNENPVDKRGRIKCSRSDSCG
jgi:hypothetical protein